MTQILPRIARFTISRVVTAAALAPLVALVVMVGYFVWHHIVSPGALLVDAARDGRVQTVERLLRLGTDPNQFRGKWSPALVAAWAGHTSVLRVLDAHGARLDDCEPDGYAPRVSPLSIAAARGHVEAVRYLVESGVSVEYQCGGGWPTPLELASQLGQAPVVTALLDLGADAKRRLDGDRTYVMVAASQERPSVIPLLVRAGCDVNARDHRRSTALMNAGEPETVTTLLYAGADINARDQEGKTALYQLIEGAVWLSENPNVSPSPYNPVTLEVLLRSGADPNIGDLHGGTPLTLSERTGPYRARIERLLIRYGATRQTLAKSPVT